MKYRNILIAIWILWMLAIFYETHNRHKCQELGGHYAKENMRWHCYVGGKEVK